MRGAVSSMAGRGRSALLALLLVSAVAFVAFAPALATAQNAGKQQYADPFKEIDGKKKKSATTGSKQKSPATDDGGQGSGSPTEPNAATPGSSSNGDPATGKPRKKKSKPGSKAPRPATTKTGGDWTLAVGADMVAHGAALGRAMARFP